MPELKTGQTLNQRFTLLRRLGRGGMAEVWLVRDEDLGQQLVAKLLPGDSPEDRVDLLRRECLHARSLVHPNIVRVFDFHRGDDWVFLTMAHVDGEGIGSLRGGSPTDILRVTLPIAEALDYAHRHGVVHRDLKVGNVLRDSDGTPYLVDFGIAGRPPDGSDKDVVRGGGSRFNVSPQQLAGRPPDASDDLYAFGVLLYELLSGSPPFWPEATEPKIREATPPTPRSVHDVPERLLTLIAALLAKDPVDRPRDMKTVRDELAETLVGLGGEIPGTEPQTDKPDVRLTPPPRAESIRPVAARPEESPADPARATGRRSLAPAWIAVVVLALTGVYLGLPWLQARLETPAAVEEAPPPDPTPSAELPARPPAPSPSAATPSSDRGLRDAYSRQSAEQALERVMALTSSLEEKGVEIWGAAELAEAAPFVTAGDEHLGSGELSLAAEAYGEAARRLEELDARSLDVLEQALRDGRHALESGDETTARAAFGLALEIAPLNQTAAHGLKRAEVLDEVQALISSGMKAERAGNVAEAVKMYSEAVAADPLSAVAQESLTRVQSRIHRDRFARAMSNGLDALDRRDYAAAREALARAEGLQPGSTEVAEALAQIDEVERIEAITANRREAIRFEADEKWQDAAERYEKVLKLDPAVRFARDGRSRCLGRASLDERLDFHLGHPDRLSSDEVYLEASNLIAEAQAVPAPGPKLQTQTNKLGQLLALAGVRVRIFLESDNLTEVTVYKVGRLGAFERRELSLRPGTYTVVGSRKGYRDVRRQLVVRGDRDTETLAVRCEEKI